MPPRETLVRTLRRPGGFVDSLLDNIEEMVCTLDRMGNVTYSNRQLRDFLGAGSGIHAWPAWRQLRDLYNADGREVPENEAPELRTLRGEDIHDLELIASVGAKARVVVVNGLQYVDDDGDLAAMLFLHDVTEQRRAEAACHFAATHDERTGLPNRALFVDRVSAALRRSKGRGTSTGILHLDIDRFRPIRDTLGYDLAQQALLEIATRIDRVLRTEPRIEEQAADDRAALVRLLRHDDATSSKSTPLARVGDHEFLIVCEEIADENAASRVVVRINEALAPPVVVNGTAFAVTVSVGITLTGDPAADPNRLISQAEVALHRARGSGGGGHWFYASGGHDESERRGMDIEALSGAIAGRQLRLVYQPKVSLLDERVIGVEALLRWEHPERGTVAPLDFIPLAEETGLIIPIGRWVLEEACRQGHQWRRDHPDGPALTVSVNVSARQLETDLAVAVAAALHDSGFDPTCLCIEVTESSVMRDVESAISTLEAVRALGVRISVDDFGTGYSSLAYLKRLPADELKVDKSFVDGLGSDPDDTAIVAAVVASAHALGLSVVAEGVETAQNVSSLKTLGCEEAQGFHFSRPVSAEAIDRIIADGRRVGVAASATVTDARAVERVLIVDDAADVRQLAHMSLAAVGFEVHEAEDGKTAIAAGRVIRPDCVVLDINIPDMSGLEVCRRLRRMPTLRNCTIVMLTSEARSGEKVQAFLLGADEYIVKPFSPRDLATRVRSAMRHRAELGLQTSANGGR